MRVARVVGQVVCSVGDPRFRGCKLLVAQPVDAAGRPADRSVVAVDTVQAGVGDYVLLVQEGKSARQEMGVKDAPCEAVLVGVVDSLHHEGRTWVPAPPPEEG
jgi:microcompartment protein CcmK/EutM